MRIRDKITNTNKPIREWDARLKRYRVYTGPRTPSVSRTTKNASGMSFTAHRSGHVLEGDALSIAVKGTCDKLATFWGIAQPVPVPPRYRLSEQGKKKLERLRRSRKNTG